MDDAHAIRLAKTELREAYRAGNVNRVLSLFSDGLGDLSSGYSSFWGPEAKAVLGHRLRQLFARYRAKLAVTVISIHVHDAWAYDWGWHKLTLVPKKGGRAITARTRYVEIWRKEGDGKWRIAIFMDNRDRPPQMPPPEVLRALKSSQPQARSRRPQGKRTLSRLAA